MMIHFSSSRDHMATWRKPYKTAFRGFPRSLPRD
jgi:hypothetical protein